MIFGGSVITERLYIDVKQDFFFKKKGRYGVLTHIIFELQKSENRKSKIMNSHPIT